MQGLEYLRVSVAVLVGSGLGGLGSGFRVWWAEVQTPGRTPHATVDNINPALPIIRNIP